MANHLSNTTVSLKTQHHVLHLCFSIVCLLCAVTVHLVFRRLHPWEVCGWQASQRAARFPGWSEERTRTSPWVTDENMLTVYEHSCSSLMKGWINLWRVCVHSRDLSMILCDPFACNTLVLSIMRNLQELLSQDSLPRVSILCRKTQKTSWRDRAYGVMVFSSFTAGGVDVERNIQSCEASKKRKKTSTKETWIQTV